MIGVLYDKFKRAGRVTEHSWRWMEPGR